MIRNIIFATLLAAFTLSASAQKKDTWDKYNTTNKDKASFIVRAGYTFGGTAPLPIPAEIRGINAFKPKGGATIGADVNWELNKRWGVRTGAHFFYEGFHTSANVKGYKMSLEQEGNVMAGYFTGCDVTNTSMWGMTVPLLATVRVSPRWDISVGPFVSVYYKKDFSGEVYDNPDGVGYIRVDSPIGQKVVIDRTSPATYDFSDNMRPWGAGVEVQFDWRALKHMNVFAQLDWGLSNALENDFDAVAFKMYPIYATVGVAYRF